MQGVRDRSGGFGSAPLSLTLARRRDSRTMIPFTRLGFCFAILFLQGSAPSAAPTFPPATPPDRMLSGAEKGQLLQQLLAQHPLQLNTTRDGREALCPIMYEALRTGIGVEFIEPAFQTEDPEDLRFAKYKRCQEFNWSVPTQLQFSRVAFLGERHFALYELNGGSDSGQRTHELIYAEAGLDQLKGLEFGGYFEIDLEECAVSQHVPIDQRADVANVSSKYTTAINALVRQGDTYFVVEAVDYGVQTRTQPEDPPVYSMQLFESTPTDGFQGACGWTERAPRRQN